MTEEADVLFLRDAFTRQGIMLCFNGPFSAELIEEIGKALRHYLEGMKESPSSVTDVFAAYIELTQNIRHYVREQGFEGANAEGTVVVSHRDGRYIVSAGNAVRQADGDALMARVDALSGLDKAALKAAYKTQLRAPREPGAKTGAGLGLIDLARKASAPLTATLKPLPDGLAFFSLRVVI